MPTTTPKPYHVSKDATPDYAPQFSLYDAIVEGRRAATVFGPAGDAHLMALAPVIPAMIDAMRCAIADLEGLLAEHDDRTHPGWQTIDELRAALDAAQQ